MTKPLPLLDRLRAWPRLWRHPALFALVHGAQGADATPSDLLDGLLATEAVETPESAWQAIVATGDIAAAQTAYDRLAVRIGVATAERDLAAAIANFTRRVERLRGRAKQLRTGGEAIERSLAQAEELVDDDPIAAERALARAEADTRIVEVRELAELERVFSSQLHGDTASGRRLGRAIKNGDLRLSLILAGQLQDSAPDAAPLDLRLTHEREKTSVLINWLLDPTFAPSHAPRADLDSFDQDLLHRLAEVLEVGTEGGEIQQVQVEQILVAAIHSLDGRATSQAIAITPITGLGDDVWALRVAGESAARLFPHVAHEEEVVLIAPRRPGLRFPLGPNGQPFIALDLFERWKPLARPDVALVTPRLLLKALLVSKTERLRRFVRLLSNTVAVRPLLLSVLGRDEARCRRLIGAPSATGASDLLASEVVAPLALALDLYVDETDLAALIDACGDRLSLLLELLPLLAGDLETPTGGSRRFDALRLLLDGEIATKVETLIEAYLRQRLGEASLVDLILSLFDAEATLMAAADGSPSLSLNDLALGLVARDPSLTLDGACKQISVFLSAGVLRSASTTVDARPETHILRGLPLPGRVLLRLQV